MWVIKRVVIFLSLLFLLYFLLSVLLPSCNHYRRNASHSHVPLSSIRKGEALAAVHCQSCHSLPDPAWLDAKSWERGVLPNMGPRLGIFFHDFESYPSARYDQNLEPGFYPAQPVVTSVEWQHIIDYYTATSPDTLMQKEQKRIGKTAAPFSVTVPPVTYPNPAVSFIKIDSTGAEPHLILYDVGKQSLFRLNHQLQVSDSIITKGSVVDMELQDDSWLVCNIGMLNPNNGRSGSAQVMQMAGDGKRQADTTTLFSQLARPVQITAADLNGDGKQDYLVCEFGFMAGALTWMENRGGGQYKKHVLRSLPGAIKAYIQDYNRDGAPDIWALFTQGEEGVFLFTNKGQGHFEQQQVLRFPPVYGSSYFELADFNKDGYPDIVYTCGDNADYSSVLKPYHGVYIFINNGNNRFTQKFFFPINGCYKAIARDFDGDADLDIAAISYFADYTRRPEEGFVYFENKGGFNFNSYSLPATQKGRWLTMEAGDWDSDGDTDLLLGNFSIGPALMKSAQDWRKGPPFIILRNRKK